MPMRIPANNAVCPRRRNKLLEIRGTIVVIRAKKTTGKRCLLSADKNTNEKSPRFQ
jgi:hypothetical protein